MNDYFFIKTTIEAQWGFAVDDECVGEYVKMKQMFDKLSGPDLRLMVEGLEPIYRVEFPKFLAGDSKVQYVKKLMKALIKNSGEVVESGNLYGFYETCFKIAEDAMPGITKKLPWWRRLFTVNKN